MIFIFQADLEIHYTFLEEKKKEMLKVICDTEEALAERQVKEYVCNLADWTCLKYSLHVWSILYMFEVFFTCLKYSLTNSCMISFLAARALLR